MLWDGELDQDIYYYCKWAQTILDQICNHGWICNFSNQGTGDFVGCSLTGAHLIQYHIHAQVWFVWNNKILCPFRPGWFFHWFHHFLRIAAELCPLRAQPSRLVQSSEPSIRIHARTNNVAPPRCSCIVQCTALQDGISLAQPFHLKLLFCKGSLAKQEVRNWFVTRERGNCTFALDDENHCLRLPQGSLKTFCISNQLWGSWEGLTPESGHVGLEWIPPPRTL